MSIRNCFCINSSQLRILFFYGGFFFAHCSDFFDHVRTNSDQCEKEEKELAKRGEFVEQKAVTYYRLKEDEIGTSTAKTGLLEETAQVYDVPITVIQRRVENELTTDEGQGVGTA